MPQTDKKNNKIVFITGAAQRIGKTIALDMAKHGWDVAVHYNSSDAPALDVVKQIEDLGQRAAALKGNLSSSSEVSQLFPQCVEQLGAPTCLINNASLFQEDEIESLDLDNWDKHLNVNLRAPVFLAQAFAKHIDKGQKGNIINIVDQRVWRLTPLFFSYTISKSGLWAATQTLAQSLAPNIRVNAIGPGPVLQSIHQSDIQFEKQAQSTLLERSTDPKEIASAIRFIIDAPAMTGQMLALDSGQHLAWQTPDVLGVEG